MFLIELIVWMVKMVFASIYQLLQTPFLLASKAPAKEKKQYLRQAAFSLPILGGTCLIFAGYIAGGIALILGTMTLGAIFVKDDGSL